MDVGRMYVGRMYVGRGTYGRWTYESGTWEVERFRGSSKLFKSFLKSGITFFNFPD